MFEASDEGAKGGKAFSAVHHPFTQPRKDHQDPDQWHSRSYDMVINGVEVGGGSIRIHDRATQEKMLSLLGFSDKEAKEQFGFLMDAFQYGAPPHGGIALGLDRLVAILGGSEIIKDFIAFPKNNNGRDMMIDAPSTLEEAQLQELYLNLLPKDPLQ